MRSAARVMAEMVPSDVEKWGGERTFSATSTISILSSYLYLIYGLKCSALPGPLDRSRRWPIHRVAGRQPPGVRLPEADQDTQSLLLGQRREAVGAQRAVEVLFERAPPEDGRLEGVACSAHDDGHRHLHEAARVRQPVDGDSELTVAREPKGGDRRWVRELRLAARDGRRRRVEQAVAQAGAQPVPQARRVPRRVGVRVGTLPRRPARRVGLGSQLGVRHAARRASAEDAEAEREAGVPRHEHRAILGHHQAVRMARRHAHRPEAR
eukprot:scaffold26522_cov63-Phaeocystis_antarctica.AAC.7